jgi:hypothetical protein
MQSISSDGFGFWMLVRTLALLVLLVVLTGQSLGCFLRLPRRGRRRENRQCLHIPR